MTINSTWTDPSDAGTLDLDTDDQLSETVWDAMMSDIKHLGGTTGMIGARVYNSANISINDSTSTALTYDSETYDTDGIHSTVSNTGRLTCVTAGKYLVWGVVNWAANVTGRRVASIQKNGATTIASDARMAVTDAAAATTQVVMDIINLAATDYVELLVYQKSGGALNAERQSDYSPIFGMVKV